MMDSADGAARLSYFGQYVRGLDVSRAKAAASRGVEMHFCMVPEAAIVYTPPGFHASFAAKNDAHVSGFKACFMPNCDASSLSALRQFLPGTVSSSSSVHSNGSGNSKQQMTATVETMIT
eukprot:4746885-Alexandrium_andersonii.AAC.1